MHIISKDDFSRLKTSEKPWTEYSFIKDDSLYEKRKALMDKPFSDIFPSSADIEQFVSEDNIYNLKLLYINYIETQDKEYSISKNIISYYDNSVIDRMKDIVQYILTVINESYVDNGDRFSEESIIAIDTRIRLDFANNIDNKLTKNLEENKAHMYKNIGVIVSCVEKFKASNTNYNFSTDFIYETFSDMAQLIEKYQNEPMEITVDENKVSNAILKFYTNDSEDGENKAPTQDNIKEIFIILCKPLVDRYKRISEFNAQSSEQFKSRDIPIALDLKDKLLSTIFSEENKDIDMEKYINTLIEETKVHLTEVHETNIKNLFKTYTTDVYILTEFINEKLNKREEN
ncbi:MAG: hypothetical protein R3Y24_14095 [Eubacteriales bacterium]